VRPLAFTASAEPSRARMRVLSDRLSPHRVSRFVTGKFCEHLGSNILNGMCAQVLRNPTFADFPFHAGGETPDGRARFQCDEARIADDLRRRAGELPLGANTLAQPEAVRPIDSELSVANGRLRLEMRPFSAARVRVPAAGERKRGAR